ncbi:DnaJ-class molecular chaperone [Altererythrobacter epoxidivorans]|uniref:DnaJ-class molecular chaperone n=1 Tax=Altererythrobacter epoxidivorans TaxID=361183 RepID=A0A0M4MVY2_9SPHN|nr:J domain-containing protein [Altererythrobacter epoxidivorans]ALE17945.1 DnaJ-class molecular chaperone [Altererythrobacter epoxidivorans]
MTRLLILLAVVSLGVKLVFGRWPWEYLQTNSTRSQALFRARKLLGVRNGATHGEIMDAHKRLIAMVHPDRGGSSAQVHEANAARDLLLDELPEQN